MSEPFTGNNPQQQPQRGNAGDGAVERQLNVLRDKLRYVDRQLGAATQNNARLVTMLETAKTEIVRLKSALEKDGQTPYSFGTVVQVNPRRQPGPGTSGVAETEESVDAVAEAGRT